MLSELEYVVIGICSSTGSFSVINYYKPCFQLDIEKFDEIMAQVRSPMMWSGDFNAQKILFGGANVNT